MKVRNYREVGKHFKLGDTVWACAFDYTGSKEGKRLYQKPVFGKFMAGSTLKSHEKHMERCPDDVGPDYFIPFKKNGKDLAWSKAVLVFSRCYASTKEECIELYNELIQENIEWHNKEIEKLKAEKI